MNSQKTIEHWHQKKNSSIFISITYCQYNKRVCYEEIVQSNYHLDRAQHDVTRAGSGAKHSYQQRTYF